MTQTPGPADEREPLLDVCLAASRSLRRNLRQAPGPDGRTRTLLLAGPASGVVRTRDLCFAAGGLLLAEEGRALRDTLDELLSRQRGDGLFPCALEPSTRAGIAGPLSPRFGALPTRPAPDSNSLLAWAAARYALHSGNLAWAGLVLPSLERGMAYYEERLEEGLFRQKACSDWKDSVGSRRGAVFFTQLLRWKALRSLEELCRAMGREKAAEAWKQESHRFARHLQLMFWDRERGYFQETLEHPRFSSEANLAAADWGLAGEEQSARIVRAVDRLGLLTPWGPRASERYPLLRKGVLPVLGGVRGLHDDGVWLWISALHLRVLQRLGRRAALDEAVRGVCSLVAAQESVSQVYDPVSGRPLRTRLLRLETPFSWSAGMLLETFHGLLAKLPAGLER